MTMAASFEFSMYSTKIPHTCVTAVLSPSLQPTIWSTVSDLNGIMSLPLGPMFTVTIGGYGKISD